MKTVIATLNIPCRGYNVNAEIGVNETDSFEITENKPFCMKNINFFIHFI